MSTLLSTISMVGTADVVVLMKKDAPRKSWSKLKKHFTKPAFDGNAALSEELRAAHFRGARATARRFSQVYDSVIELPHLGMMVGTVDQSGLKAVRKASTVARVVASPEISLIRPTREGTAAAKNAAQTDNWGLKIIGIQNLWTAGLMGEGVKVGHLDTGVDDQHPALNGAIVGWLETDHAGKAVSASTAYDDDGHGTHTAGTLAARKLPGAPAIGTAPRASLYCAKCIEGGDVTRRVLVSLNWAVGEGVRIISMSLGIRGYTDGWRAIATRLRSLGVLLVCAVGNEGANTSRSPGNYPDVLSVGMTNPLERVDPDSSSQKFEKPEPRVAPRLVAPGTDIASTYPSGTYEFLTGSSMATPLVAGLAALLLQSRPSATVRQLETAIVQSCQLPSTIPAIRGGAGIPNGPRAHALLQGMK